MAFHSGIQGLRLEVTVISCHNLEDKEWLSRQDPYVCVQYGNSQFRTRTCTEGGKNPSFQEKFILQLIEGLPELTVSVWNSNTVVADDHIGSAKVLLQKTLSQGYDDTTWPLLNKHARHSGQVKLILHCSNASASIQQHSQLVPPPVFQPTTPSHHSTIPYSVPLQPPPVYPAPAYSHGGPASPFPGLQQAGYPPQPQVGPGLYPPQQLVLAGYLQQPQAGYPASSSSGRLYGPSSYPPQHHF